MRGGLIRTILLVCALAAMGLRGALPPGFMFGADDGRVAVMLCSGETVSIDIGKHDGKPPQQHVPCAFAAVAQATSAPDAVAIDAPLARVGFVAPRVSTLVRVGQGLAAPPPPATGPPLLI